MHVAIIGARAIISARVQPALCCTQLATWAWLRRTDETSAPKWQHILRHSASSSSGEVTLCLSYFQSNPHCHSEDERIRNARICAKESRSITFRGRRGRPSGAMLGVPLSTGCTCGSMSRTKNAYVRIMSPTAETYKICYDTNQVNVIITFRRIQTKLEITESALMRS